MTLRVALIGTNYGGSVQIPGVQLVQGVEVVAVASARLERARAVAAQWRIPHAFDDYVAMLDSVPVDLVSVATPPYLHHQMVLEAAARGIHVLCEKPLALNVGQVEEMLDAVTARGLVHAVDHEFRYFRGLAAFKSAVDRGVLGEARVVRVVWRSDVRSTPEQVGYSWWSERGKGGGVLGAVASHWIDAFRWWFGEPRDIHGQLNTYVPARADESGVMRSVATDDTASLIMRLGRVGTQASIDVSMAVGPPGYRVEAYGTAGALVLDSHEDLHVGTGQDPWQPVPLAPERFASQPGQPPNVAAFAALVADVQDAIGGRGPSSLPNFSDGLAVQRVLDTVYAQDRV